MPNEAAAGVGQQVYHMRSLAPGTPAFEWHPLSRKLYVIVERAGKTVGEVAAFNIDKHGDAINARLIWLRGFQHGSAPLVSQTHLQL